MLLFKVLQMFSAPRCNFDLFLVRKLVVNWRKVVLLIPS